MQPQQPPPTFWQALKNGMGDAIRAQDENLRLMRQRAEENPGDLNTIGFPDWATGSSTREKKIQNAILGAMEKQTGRDLSEFKEQ